MRWGGVGMGLHTTALRRWKQEADEDAERGRVHLVVWALKTSSESQKKSWRVQTDTVAHVVSFRGTPSRNRLGSTTCNLNLGYRCIHKPITRRLQ